MSLTLEDSTTYQLILERGITQGIAQGEQAILLRQGTKRFGPPSPEIEATVRAITDRTRLERLADRILDAANWNDLLATP